MAVNTDIPHFTRDPSLSSDIADQFGGGASKAEQLILASQLRQSPELAAANLLPENIERRGDFDFAAVAKAAELDDDSLIDHSWTVRGNYLTYLFEMPDGRVGKDALLIDGDSLSLPDREETPERAALRAQVSANNKVREAESEAQRIVREAREEASRIVQEAADKAKSERADEAKKAAKASGKDDDAAKKQAPNPGVRTPQRKPGDEK